MHESTGAPGRMHGRVPAERAVALMSVGLLLCSSLAWGQPVIPRPPPIPPPRAFLQPFAFARGPPCPLSPKRSLTQKYMSDVTTCLFERMRFIVRCGDVVGAHREIVSLVRQRHAPELRKAERHVWCLKARACPGLQGVAISMRTTRCGEHTANSCPQGRRGSDSNAELRCTHWHLLCSCSTADACTTRHAPHALIGL